MKFLFPGDCEIRRNNLHRASIIIEDKIRLARKVHGWRRIRGLVSLLYGERRRCQASE